jgi:PAS domain S-box-containing protein
MTVSMHRAPAGPGLPATPSRCLETDAALFRSFFERSGLPVARLDREMRIVLANPDFQRRFGGTRRDLRGTDISEILHPDHRDRVGLRLSTLSNNPGSRFTERVAVRTDGRTLTCRLTALAAACGETELLDGVIVLLDDDRTRDDAPASTRQMLSEVEARILEGVSAGASTVQLAAALFLSRGGVEYHLKSLMRRFKVKNRPALISKAYAAGILRVGCWPPHVPRNLVK